MSVVASDIKYYYTGTGTSSNPGGSLGGASTSYVVATTIEKLFGVVTPEEALAGSVKYRAIDVKNDNGSDTLYSAYLWISTETTSPNTTVAIAYDSVGTQSIANETTAPTGVTFSTPLSKATGVLLGDMTPTDRRRIWLKRTVTAGVAKTTDSGSLTVGGGTI